ncbi:hypothetical protein MIND_00906000 [Mycena indigotica]|uniref:Uncharacterized protein n=1 Tax=Mycena indigotica TaxID=2126181 RepID=A0A8H6W2A5_9AGAR|nr:uncharacterized protein MIND_00906000 [Mycena indigotica]KAF7296754.1 hypothetical protein MIND_00906000 [Mycena indigotica]
MLPHIIPPPTFPPHPPCVLTLSYTPDCIPPQTLLRRGEYVFAFGGVGTNARLGFGRWCEPACVPHLLDYCMRNGPVARGRADAAGSAHYSSDQAILNPTHQQTQLAKLAGTVIVCGGSFSSRKTHPTYWLALLSLEY